VDAIKFMQERVSAHLASEISTADMTAVWGNIAGVKGYLNKAIDNNLLASDPQLAQILKNTIAAVNVQSREDVIMNYYGKGDADSVEAFAAYTAPEKQGGCGNDGLVDNAFAFTTSSGKRMVIVCPGLVMSAIKGGSDSQSNFRNLIQTLAHEMGHHIDSRHAPALYAKLNQCLATNYADGLQIGSQSSLALKVGIYKDPAQLNLKKTEEHSAESTADFWATEAIVSYMDDYAAKLSTRDKLGFLREAYGAFCGTGDEGIHPDGKYRINVLLRNSLAMNRIMGCANRFPDGKAACKLWGGLVPFDRQQIQLKPILLPSQGHSARSPAPQEAPVSREAAGL
jgi:hypothetical protein